TVGSDNSSTTYSGAINGTGSLIKAGTGTMTLGTTNAYTGGTTANAGTLAAGAGNAFRANNATTGANGATLQLPRFNQSIGNLTGAGTVTSNSSTGATLTVTNTADSVFSGNITQTGAGALGLTKTGTFMETLSGANTYGGPTAVNVGTLQAGSTTGF